MFTAKVHSVVDLITNSSTTIYTNSDNCVEPFKRLVDEVLELIGSTYKCDDVFEVAVMGNMDRYLDIVEYNLKAEKLVEYGLADLAATRKYDERRNILESQYLDYKHGKTDEPKWLIAANEYYGEESVQDSTLIIKAKNQKFEKLGKYIFDLMYSPNAFEVYNG